MSNDDNNNPSILVIGGGPSGLVAVSNLRQLDPQVSITLVEPKDYCEIAWATFRTPFDTELAEETLLPLEPWCQEHKVTHIRALVTKLTEEEATLDNGSFIKFTIAVVCAGASAPWKGLGRGPAKLSKEERLKQLQEEGDKLLNASSVVIVGGGLIGVELAGDLADFAKEKGNDSIKITVVHSGPHLCHADCTEGCGNMLQEKLEQLGVQVILNEKAEKTDDGNLKLTQSGETLEAQEVVMTIGVSSVNKSFLDAKYLDEKGWLQVDHQFRVQGSQTLMAVGDCCNFLMNAGNQVFFNRNALGHNIKQVLDENVTGAEAKPLKNAAPFEVLKITTVGRNDGVAQLPWGIYTQYIFPKFKNETMFISKFRNYAGYGDYDSK